MPDIKWCPKCKIEKSIDDFGIVVRNKDGRRNICKACYNKIRSMPEVKEKRRLHNLKPEYKLWRNKISREYRKRPEVKQREIEYRRKKGIQKRKNKGTNHLKKFIRLIKRKWLKCPIELQRKKDKQREYFKTPEWKRYRQEYNKRPEVIQRKKEVYEKTPEWKAAHVKACHKRRAKIKDLEYSLTYEQWNKIIELQGNACAICRKAFTKKNPATRDHIIPASRAGPFTRENCQAVHKDCNSKKKDKIDKSNIVSWITRPDLCVEEMP